MHLIGVSEDLIDHDGRPRHPAVDLAKLLSTDVRIQPVAIPLDRLVARGSADLFDILVLGDCGIAREEILSARRARMICQFGKGYDDIDIAAATERAIVVTRVVKAGEDSMATGVMALILALSTRLPQRSAIAQYPAQSWDAPLAHGAVGLKGKILGIIGYGRIGQEVAKRAAGFGFRIVCYDPYYRSAAPGGVEQAGLDELLSRSDFVSINCPLTDETRGLITYDKLGLMKPSAYLVNTGRGAVVDEAGLCMALGQGKIAGAALDVFTHEPLPRDSILRTAPNLIMTPHAIGVSDEMYAEYMQSVAASITQLISGRCPVDAINPAAFRAVRPAPSFPQ